MQEEAEAKQEAKYKGEVYSPVKPENGDTKKQLLARSRYLLFKSPDKWLPSQKQRTRILFTQHPDKEDL